MTWLQRSPSRCASRLIRRCTSCRRWRQHSSRCVLKAFPYPAQQEQPPRAEHLPLAELALLQPVVARNAPGKDKAAATVLPVAQAKEPAQVDSVPQVAAAQ